MPMSELLKVLNLFVWVFVLFHLSSHSYWRDVLPMAGYAPVYYAVLYYLYRKDRMFEFYLIGFMLRWPRCRIFSVP